ncbi:hypothetical protein GALMADRAFT_144196 [Galerina marginata CBS 339.88]|uniref:Uncharacterized protein n=1 Tax=Galerina marginata (strain CBS 339.88) TaxID=685588 RepID=A0A067SJK3_GALM3|nr:hypothetical protein GALMADRAFT_144196 [Galerina marginata CBS 339.88]
MQDEGLIRVWVRYHLWLTILLLPRIESSLVKIGKRTNSARATTKNLSSLGLTLREDQEPLPAKLRLPAGDNSSVEEERVASYSSLTPLALSALGLNSTPAYIEHSRFLRHPCVLIPGSLQSRRSRSPARDYMRIFYGSYVLKRVEYQQEHPLSYESSQKTLVGDRVLRGTQAERINPTSNRIKSGQNRKNMNSPWTAAENLLVCEVRPCDAQATVRVDGLEGHEGVDVAREWIAVRDIDDGAHGLKNQFELLASKSGIMTRKPMYEARDKTALEL